MSTCESRSVRSVAAPCAGVVRKRTTDGCPEANSSYRISSASRTLATSRHAPATRRSQLLPWEPSTVAQSPGYDCAVEDIWSTAKPHPATAARSSSGPSATPVSASTSCRRRRVPQHAAIPIQHERRRSVAHDQGEHRPPERRWRFETDRAGLREAAENPAAKFLAAGAARQRELRAQRPDAAALRGRLRVRGRRVGKWRAPAARKRRRLRAAGRDERTEAKHRRESRAADADCA